MKNRQRSVAGANWRDIDEFMPSPSPLSQVISFLIVIRSESDNPPQYQSRHKSSAFPHTYALPLSVSDDRHAVHHAIWKASNFSR